MTDKAIRHVRRGRRYKAPVLVEHSNLRWFVMTTLTCLFMIFLSGYLLGFYKSETKITTGSIQLPLNLPTLTQLAGEEPRHLITVAPGETIDVDLADITHADSHIADTVVATNTVASDAVNREVKTAVISPPEKPPVLAKVKSQNVPKLQSRPQALGAEMPIAVASIAKAPITKSTRTRASIEKAPQAKALITEAPIMLSKTKAYTAPIGGPAPTDPGQDDRLSVLHDDATEESALYTLQLGTYKKMSNADRKIEELRAAELNSYMTEFIDKTDTVLYNVRLGYYAGYSSAQEALAMYKSEMSGSGYVIRIKR